MADAAQGEGTDVEPSGQFGLFVFLASEGLLFGGLLLVYTVARLVHPEIFVAGAKELSLPLGTANTAILLTSSLAVALATLWSEQQHAARARLSLLVTVCLGAAFLVIKGMEYAQEASRGLLPMPDPSLRDPFATAEPHRLFFNIYLALTGTHALHLITGMLVLGFIALWWRRLHRPAHTLKLAGLYWHFIDVIWVFLFPLLYLVRS